MEAEFLKRIVKEAEKISQQSYEVHQKDDRGDLVTNLDLEIEQYLINQIKENYPGYDIVSEEFNTDGTVTDNCFTIDPIDGTINFANGLPLWGIQVACRKNGETVAAVINLPRLGEFYFADETGAYLNGQPISVKEVPLKNTVYTVLGNNALDATKRMREYSKGHRSLGAACVSFAFVACGRLHGTNFRINTPWDYEPGLFICEKAGAKVKSADGFHAAAMNQEFLDLLEKETRLRS